MVLNKFLDSFKKKNEYWEPIHSNDKKYKYLRSSLAI